MDFMSFANSASKKIICLLLTLMMLPLGGLVASADVSYTLSEDFEKFKIGKAAELVNYVTDKGNDYAIEESNGNKYLRMSITTDKDMHYDVYFSSALSGKFTLEFDIMFKDYGSVQKLVEFMDDARNDTFLCTFEPDGYLKLPDGTNAASYALNKFYRVKMAFDTEQGTMDLFFNGKKRASGYTITMRNAAILRIHMRQPAGESTACIDNLSVYSGEPGDGSGSGSSVNIDTASIMKNASAMYIGKSNALLNGKKTYTSAGRDIIPYEKGGEYMVPVRFFAQSIGADISYDESDDTTHISYKGKEIVLGIGASDCKVNGETTKLSVPCEIGGGSSLYAPIDDLCGMTNLFLHTEENGVIIYSEDDMSDILDWQKNTNVMRRICESYMFDDMSGEEMTKLLTERYPNKQHPRLVMTEDKFEAIRNEVFSPDGDEVYKKAYDHLKIAADTFVAQPTSGYYLPDGIRLEATRENAQRIITLALMYNISKDEKYAERAWLEMYTSACFRDWNPYHFLDVGAMATGMGLGYDWLYNWMDESQRKIVRDSIVNKAIVPINEDFDDAPRSRSWNWRGDLADNWCLVISGVGSCGAMAIVDELDGQNLEKAQRAMEQCLLDIRRALSLFSPLGAYEEGPSYWEYSMRYYPLTVTALETGIGTALGYDDIPGLKLTDKYLLAVNGPVKMFSYHDAYTSDSIVPPAMMYIANHFGRYSEAKSRISFIMNNEAVSAGSAYADMLWYDPKLGSASDNTGDLDIYMPISEVAVMRSGWGKNDTYVGFHCDDPLSGESHDHMDAGEFVLQAMGEEFFFDLGKDDYNIPNYLNCYRVRAEGHNTVIFNPDEGYAQKYGGTAKITETEFKPRGGFAIANMTNAYDREKTGVTEFKRGIKLDSDRNRTVVQDEIKLEKSAEMYWFAHTKADIDISEDKKSAILTMNGKKLLAQIMAGDGAEFSVMDAKPLPTSPVIAEQNPNEGVRKLTIHIPQTDSINLAVSFVNYDMKYNAARFDNTFVALDDWSIEDGEIVEPESAKLTALKVNGQLIDGFRPDKYEYNYNVTDENAGKLTVTAESEHKFEINESENVTGDTTILVTPSDASMYPSEYVVHFNSQPEISVPNLNKVKPVKVTASDIPESANGPDNTVDGSLGTRWSCPGACWIEYDLGSLKKLDSMGIAFMDGDQRTAQFTIKTSKDGVNYDTFYSGDATSTLQLVNYKMFGREVRYVRVEGRGYDGNPDEYTSITEVEFYEN